MKFINRLLLLTLFVTLISCKKSVELKNTTLTKKETEKSFNTVKLKPLNSPIKLNKISNKGGAKVLELEKLKENKDMFIEFNSPTKNNPSKTTTNKIKNDNKSNTNRSKQ